MARPPCRSRREPPRRPPSRPERTPISTRHDHRSATACGAPSPAPGRRRARQGSGATRNGISRSDTALGEERLRNCGDGGRQKAGDEVHPSLGIEQQGEDERLCLRIERHLEIRGVKVSVRRELGTERLVRPGAQLLIRAGAAIVDEIADEPVGSKAAIAEANRELQPAEPRVLRSRESVASLGSAAGDSIELEAKRGPDQGERPAGQHRLEALIQRQIRFVLAPVEKGSKSLNAVPLRGHRRGVTSAAPRARGEPRCRAACRNSKPLTKLRSVLSGMSASPGRRSLAEFTSNGLAGIFVQRTSSCPCGRLIACTAPSKVAPEFSVASRAS